MRSSISVQAVGHRVAWSTSVCCVRARRQNGHPNARIRAYASREGSQGSPGWPFNLEIAQREVLRRYYLTTAANEMLEVVTESSQLLDENSLLDLLCHTANVKLKGQLRGSPDELAQALHEHLAAHIPAMKPVQLGSLLWGLATVGCSRMLAEALLEQVASQELASRRVGSYSTRELCSIIHAYGRLVSRRTSSVYDYTTVLVEDLVQRIRTLPHVRSSLSAGDCAELAAGLAAIYENFDNSSSNRGSSATSGSASSSSSSSNSSSSSDNYARTLPPPAAVQALLDELATEVKRQLANKHSMGSPLNSRELLMLVASFARLDHRSAKVSGMLDSVAGFVSRRIRDRHLNAVSRPHDLSRLLQAYAALQHNSVAIPELLSAVNEQMCLNAAQLQEREGQSSPSIDTTSIATGGIRGTTSSSAHMTQSVDSSGRATSPATAGHGSPPAADTSLPLPDIILILESHVELGYAPSTVMLQGMMPACCRQLQSVTPSQALRLLQLLAVARFNPGQTVLQLILARVMEGGRMAASSDEGRKEREEWVREGEQLVAELSL